MNRGELLKALLPLLTDEGGVNKDSSSSSGGPSESSEEKALTKADVEAIVKEALQKSVPDGAKAPDTQANGLTPDSLKNMTAEQINENWDEVSKTLSSMATN